MTRARRFLLVVPPFIGHANPMISVARELASRGHAVAWASHRNLRALVADPIRYFGIAEDEQYLAAMRSIDEQPTRFLAESFVRLYEETLLPLGRSMQRAVEHAAEVFAPDVMVVDQHALAGALVARRRGLPWATSAASGQLLVVTLPTHLRVRRWLDETLAPLQCEAGLEPVGSFDVSPHLALLYTSLTFATGTEHVAYPDQFRFVGPLLEHRDDDSDFPWNLLDARPRVVVSLGTIVAGRSERFLHVVSEALGDRSVQVILSAPDGVLPAPPANFIVRPWIPQLRLFPQVQAVLSHGGSTVHEALAFGVPLVVAPVMQDGFFNAQKVVEAGAGIRIKFGRVAADALRRAIFDVIENPRYRAAARSIGDSFAAAGGTRAAADALEGVECVAPPARVSPPA